MKGPHRTSLLSEEGEVQWPPQPPPPQPQTAAAATTTAAAATAAAATTTAAGGEHGVVDYETNAASKVFHVIYGGFFQEGRTVGVHQEVHPVNVHGRCRRAGVSFSMVSIY